MKIVQKGNRQLKINDDDLENYLNQGYCEINNAGKVVTKSTEKNIERENSELLKEVSRLTQESEELKAELSASRAEIEALKADKEGTEDVKSDKKNNDVKGK